MRPTIAVGGLAVAVLVGGTGLALALRDDAPPAVQVRLAAVQRGAVTAEVSAAGSTLDGTRRDLAFGSAGTVTKVYVKVGSKVKKGQVLARVDSRAAREAYEAAQADLSAAEEARSDLSTATNSRPNPARGDLSTAGKAQGDRSSSAAASSRSSTAGVPPTCVPARGNAPSATDGPSEAGADSDARSHGAGVRPAEAGAGGGEFGPPGPSSPVASPTASPTPTATARHRTSHEPTAMPTPTGGSFTPRPGSGWDHGGSPRPTATTHPHPHPHPTATPTSEPGDPEPQPTVTVTVTATATVTVTAPAPPATGPSGGHEGGSPSGGPDAGGTPSPRATGGATASPRPGRPTPGASGACAGSGGGGGGGQHSYAGAGRGSGGATGARTDTAGPGRAGVGSAEQAAASVERAEAAVEEAADAVRGTRIVAPAAGTVLSVAGGVGDAAGTGAFIGLGNLNELQVQAMVTESDVNRLKLGQKAQITLATRGDEQHAGTVTAIAPNATVDGRLVRYAVTLAFDDPPKGLMLGQTASVTITTDEAMDAVYVPAAAVRRRPDGTQVVTVRSGGRDTAKVVETGVHGDQYVEVVSGLSESDRVVMPGGASGEFPDGTWPGA
ncbi:RND family efflux transporter, MFP subunit [Nonomuraea maritima]|uniref:RND family efflux transporter, MFP subunit n=1 Tax=Nonomuraea maritima TaxID=683260 RepID=A0A1G8WBE9_9ACTN|nr:efflux RND transporter periplasmic adaptor subunit [Nonomuraea maritima]SDJ75609.1 RND family efflux transporter, MFP subunit [Nonomuraea maritima]